jgi:hypothetical protein
MNEFLRKTIIGRETYRYIWGAVIICFLILINHLGMTLLINEQQRHIAISKLSSQQRILLLDASQLADDILTNLAETRPNYYLIQNLQKELGLLTKDLVQTHEDIIKLADKNIIPFLPKTNARAYYFEEPYSLDERINSFVAKLQLLASHDPKTIKRRFHRWIAVGVTVSKHGLLVQGFDEVMKYLFTASSNHAKVLKISLQILNGLVILTIILERMLVFKPLVERSIHLSKPDQND